VARHDLTAIAKHEPMLDSYGWRMLALVGGGIVAFIG
jgi:hypothetical protein